MDEFLSDKDDVHFYLKTLKCFYSGTPFEIAKGLGFCVNIRRAGAGRVKDCHIYTDTLMFKKFKLRKVTSTPTGSKFGYWFPTFFRKSEYGKNFYLAEKSLSLMLKNNSNYFQPEMVLKVLLPALYNKISAISRMESTPCEKNYQEVVYIQTLVHLFLRKYP